MKLCFILLNLIGYVYSTENSNFKNLPAVRPKRNSSGSKSIVNEPQCEEVKKLCPGLAENKDLLILECLYSLEPNTLNSLNHYCQNVIWEHTHALTNNENVKATLAVDCPGQVFKCQPDSQPGSYLKCVINNKEEIRSSDCITAVLRLKDVAFHDFQWLENFLQYCTDDVKKRNCGRIDGDSLTQSVTIACLQNDLNNLQERCRKEVRMHFRFTMK